jgi:hypothetical protein
MMKMMIMDQRVERAEHFITVRVIPTETRKSTDRVRSMTTRWMTSLLAAAGVWRERVGERSIRQAMTRRFSEEILFFLCVY